MRWLDGIINLMNMNLSKLRENSEGQESLACCSPRGPKELDTTEQLNNNSNVGDAVGCFWCSIFLSGG